MAYAQRWYVEVYDNTGNQYQAKIFQDGYVGSVTQLDAYSDGVILSYQNVSNIFSPIRGSQLTLSVKNDDNFDYKEFYEGDYADFKAVLVDITDSNTSIWTGYGQPENYSEPFVDYPYPSKLTFTCGLGELKNKEFTDTSALHTGQMHLIQLVRWCTNELATPLVIRESFNVYASVHNNTSSDSAMAQTHVDSRIFREVNSAVEEGQNCYKVLEAILVSLGCFITQYDNEWWIVRAKEQTGDLYWRSFGANVGNEHLTAVSGSSNLDIEVTALDTADEMTFINSNASMSIENRIRKVIYKLDLQRQLMSSLIRNGGFDWDLGINSDTLPMYWTRSGGMSTGECEAVYITDERRVQIIAANASLGIAQVQSEIEKDSGGEILLKFENQSNYWAGAGASQNTTDYVEIVSEDILIQSGDSMKWQCQYKSMSENKVIIPMDIIVRDTVGATDYYYNGAVGQPTALSPLAIDYNPSPDKWTDSRSSTNLIFPFTGNAKITMRLYPLHGFLNDGSNVSNFYFKNFSLKYVFADGTEPQLERLITKTIDNRHDTFNLTATIGQGINYPDTAALRASDATLLEEWDRRDPSTGTLASENLDLCDVVPCEVLDTKATFSKRITGELHQNTKQLTPISRIHIPVPEGGGTTNVYCSVIGMSWNLQRSAFNFTASEIVETTQSPTTTDLGGNIGNVSIIPHAPKDTGTMTVPLGDLTSVEDTTTTTDYPG
jgi:hypothetical protein